MLQKREFMQGLVLRGRGYLWYLLLIGAVLWYPRVFTKPFPQHLMIMVAIYAILGTSWNIVGGYTGQVSLGHSVYFAVGAYTSTLLFMKSGVTPWLGMLAGGMLAVLVSFIIGYPTFRLQGRYFAIATLAIVQIVYTIAINWQFVGGAVGLLMPFRRGDRLVNFQFHASKVPYFYIAWCMVGLALLVTNLIERSCLGYYFKAIRDDQSAAESLGIDATRYKMIALAISAFMAATAGTFYAQYVMYIDPDSTLLLSVTVVLVAVMGGVGELWGPLLGALTLIPLSQLTRVYLSGRGQALDLILYGTLVVVITIYQPRGMIGLIRGLGRNLNRRRLTWSS